MSRPSKRRYVSPVPGVGEFRPFGVPERDLHKLVLPLDGLEALRLTDLVGLEQVEAARQMGVSRQTFGRILASARRIVSQALVCGLALTIAPTGNVEIKPLGSAIYAEAEAHIRVAVSAHAPSLDAAVAPRFGRAPGFLLVDPRTLQFKYIGNAGTEQESGFGPRAAALIANAGATVLLTGFVGVKAARSLAKAGILVADGLGGLIVRDAVERFTRGEILPVSLEDTAADRANGVTGMNDPQEIA